MSTTEVEFPETNQQEQCATSLEEVQITIPDVDSTLSTAFSLHKIESDTSDQAEVSEQEVV